MTRPFIPRDQVFDLTRELQRIGGYPRGDFPGWRPVNELYTVAPGQWTVITGTPQSGKSELLDAMMVNLAENHGWRFALYSPENWPAEVHVAKLCEKRVRKPFGAGKHRPMTAAELESALEWVSQHFEWLQPPDGDCSPENLLATALAYTPKGADAKRYGVALDPWNTLDHIRAGGMSETDYVSYILSGVTKLVRAGQCHCWLVVHPAKLARLKDGSRPVPTPYDISGSAHWYNKADNIICVHRDQTEDSDRVEIHVQKVRFKHVGHIGLAELRWDKVTGRYYEAPNIPDPISRTGYEQYRDPEAAYE